MGGRIWEKMIYSHYFVLSKMSLVKTMQFLVKMLVLLRSQN